MVSTFGVPAQICAAPLNATVKSGLLTPSTTVVTDCATQLPRIRSTVYVPAYSIEKSFSDGVRLVAVNPLGPVHRYSVAPTSLIWRARSSPTHTGLLLLAVPLPVRPAPGVDT